MVMSQNIAFNKVYATLSIISFIPGPEGYTHLFIGSYIYKLKDSCPPNESCILPGYPQPIRSVYKRAPRKIGAAAFIPDERQRTYFFKGEKTDQTYNFTFKSLLKKMTIISER